EHAIVPLLSVIDPFLFEMGSGITDYTDFTDRRGRRNFPQSFAESVSCVVLSLSFLFRAGDAKQTLSGNAAFCARALRVVDARKNSLARCASAGAVCADLSPREPLDGLGTEISRARDWSGLGPSLSGTSDYRW